MEGAYLSDVDDELLSILFGDSTGPKASGSGEVIVSVETGSQLGTIKLRLGQARFADEIKELYGNRCCFPGCEISDPRFLVASHIARWCDNERLRGELGNGLCLCLIHDKAFEVGLYTIDDKHAVFINPRERESGSTVVQQLLEMEGEQIQASPVLPMARALDPNSC